MRGVKDDRHEGIEMRELLDTTSLNIHYSGGKVINWPQQADFFIAAAGIFAILVGFIGIWDGVAETHNRRLRRGGVDSYVNANNLQHAILHEFTGSSDLLPLVLFGAVTAFAWTCTGRAVFRLNSMEAGQHIASRTGIPQRELSNVFELKSIDIPWLKWRLRLWRSSLFAMANVLLYAGAGVSYRAAFSTRSQFVTAPIEPSTQTRPLIGCPKSTRNFQKFVELMGTGRGTSSGLSDFLGTTLDVSWNDWMIAFGWHQYRFMDSETELLQRANLTGPFILQVMQFAGIATILAEPTLEVARHPTCGDLPKYCLAGGGCFWLGIWAAELNVEIRFVGNRVYTDDDNIDLETANIKCPIQLNSGLYEKVIEINKPNRNHTDTFFHETMALTLSYMHTNSSLIENRTLLDNLGFLPPKDGSCSNRGNYEGEMYFEIRSNFWPHYQYLACSLVIIWGGLLVFAAYPFKTYLVRGTLNQYMSFGSDIGQEEMLGTSSGLCGSGGSSHWRFALRNESGCGRMVLEEVQEGEESQDGRSVETPRLRFGTKWI